MTDRPFRHLHHNIIVGHGSRHRAVYRLGMVSYPLLTTADKFSWRARLSMLAFDMEADFTLARVWRGYPAAGYVDQAITLADPRYADTAAARAYLERHRPALERPGGHRSELYLLVDIGAGITGGVRGELERAADIAERALGVDRARRVPGALLAALTAAEQLVLAKTAGWLPARRASTREIVWLCRRSAYRGLAEPQPGLWAPDALRVAGPTGEIAYEPDATALERLWTPVREVDGTIEVMTDTGPVYQAVMAVGDHERWFPGGEIMFSPLERCVPVDSFTHVQWRDNLSAHKKLKRKLRDAAENLDELDQAARGPLSRLPERQIRLALDLEEELGGPDAPPMLQVYSLLALAGRTRKGLDERCAALQRAYGNIRLWRPAGAQLEMYRQTLPRARIPGGGGRMFREWTRTQDWAAGMPVATQQLAADTGVYWARVQGTNRPLFANLRAPALDDRSAAWLLAGTTGSGKSFAYMLLLLQAALLGSQVLDIDPDTAGDGTPGHRWEEIPEIQGLRGGYHVVDLDDTDAYAGLLDPLVVSRAARSVDVTHSYLMSMIAGDVPGCAAIVRGAIVDTVEQDARPCCQAVISRLLKPSRGEIAVAAGETLGSWARAGLARLGFGDGTRVRADRAQFTTLRIAALQLPPREVERDQWEPVEALSVATLGLIVQSAVDVADADRSRHKAIGLDEAHFVLGSLRGQALVAALTRQARKKFASLLLASQYVTDPGQLRNLIGTLVMFGFEQLGEARDALELLGLDRDDDEQAERLRAQRRGACFVRDHEGHVVPAQIDAVDPQLTARLGARPREQRRPVREQDAWVA